jgi:hypothetical protein
MMVQSLMVIITWVTCLPVVTLELTGSHWLVEATDFSYSDVADDDENLLVNLELMSKLYMFN